MTETVEKMLELINIDDLKNADYSNKPPFVAHIRWYLMNEKDRAEFLLKCSSRLKELEEKLNNNKDVKNNE